MKRPASVPAVARRRASAVREPKTAGTEPGRFNRLDQVRPSARSPPPREAAGLCAGRGAAKGPRVREAKTAGTEPGRFNRWRPGGDPTAVTTASGRPAGVRPPREAAGLCAGRGAAKGPRSARRKRPGRSPAASIVRPAGGSDAANLTGRPARVHHRVKRPASVPAVARRSAAVRAAKTAGTEPGRFNRRLRTRRSDRVNARRRPARSPPPREAAGLCAGRGAAKGPRSAQRKRPGRSPAASIDLPGQTGPESTTA